MLTAEIPWWELAAMLLAVAYLVLAVRQHIACWAAAILSGGIYTVLMLAAGLYMQSALQLFYIAMAVYGWFVWSANSGPQRQMPVSSWPLAFNLLPLLIIISLGLVSGALLAHYTTAAFPYTDSFTTWGAVVATWMVARKILQNWYYWFAVDTVSIYLYIQRELWLTAGLFCVYLILIVVGYRSWKKSMDPA